MPRRRRFRPNYPLWLAVFVLLGAIAAYIGLGVLFSWLAPRRPGMPSTLYLAFVARCLDATLAVWFFRSVHVLGRSSMSWLIDCRWVELWVGIRLVPFARRR